MFVDASIDDDCAATEDRLIYTTASLISEEASNFHWSIIASTISRLVMAGMMNDHIEDLLIFHTPVELQKPTAPLRDCSAAWLSLP